VHTEVNTFPLEKAIEACGRSSMMAFAARVF
jgi:hypothetical protein